MRKILTVPNIIAAGLVGWALFWGTFNAWHFSVTNDELIYAPAGIRMLQAGEIVNNEHPPLNKLIAGATVLLTQPNIAALQASSYEQWTAGEAFWFQSGNPTQPLLFLARMPFVIIFALGLTSVFLVINKRYGIIAGLGALAALALNPTLIGHAALSTNDVLLAVTIWFLVLATLRFIEKKTLQSALWWGSALAFVLLAKFSGIIFVGMAMLITALIVLPPQPLRIRLRRLGFWVIGVAVMLVLVWAAYAFVERNALFTSNVSVSVNLPIIHQERASRTPWKKALAVPLLRYYEGYATVQGHNRLGHLAYLDGELQQFGWRGYFVKTLGYKTPLIITFFAIAGLCVALMKRTTIALTVAGAAIVFIAIASLGHIDIGVRHVLPIYFLLAPLVGLALAAIISLRKPFKWALLGGGAVLLILDLALNSPNRLSFFTQAAGGWRQGYQRLGDSNTDWGQELPLLSAWLQSNPQSTVLIGSIGENPAYRGIDYQSLSNFTCQNLPADATVIASVNYVIGLFGAYPCLREQASTAERVGHTVMVFQSNHLKR